jgi:hypothetical protein
MTSPTHAPVFRRSLLLAILLLWIPSCGSNRQPCYPVHGEVFAGRGQERTPAAGAVVVFHPAAPASDDVPRPSAHVGDDGKFVLTTYVKDDGAPAGDYTITIEWAAPRPPPPFKPTQTGDRLKGLYSDPRTSRLKYSVEKSSDNNVPSIELQLP